MNKLVKSIAFFAVAATAELACAYGLSDSFFVLNGMWYTGSSSYVQHAARANSHPRP